MMEPGHAPCVASQNEGASDEFRTDIAHGGVCRAGHAGRDAHCAYAGPRERAGDRHEQETRSIAAIDEVLSAIDKTEETTGRIRKVTTLDAVDIVFLSDAAQTEGGPPPEIEAKIAEHQDEIAELRKELEGNAMLFHAVDSRNVLMRDIIAVAFSGEGKVTIYATAKPPS